MKLLKEFHVSRLFESNHKQTLRLAKKNAFASEFTLLYLNERSLNP